MEKTDFRKAIHAQVKKWSTAYRGSPAWLQTAVELNESLRFPTSLKPVVDRLFHTLIKTDNAKKIEQKQLDFEILLANLLFHRQKRPIRLTFARSAYGKSRYKKLSLFTLDITKIMDAAKLLNMKKGNRSKTINGERFQTRIWPTEELLKLFKPFPESVVYEPTELVLLTDANGKLKEYRDTKRTNRIRSLLQLANTVNEAADIQIKLNNKFYELHTFLHATFKRKFTLHGRLYTTGFFHYQQFDAGERATITINGEPVTELDFSGLHPRLLYAKEGVQYNEDPYSVINPDPIARPFLKAILLRLLNAKNRVKAESAANYWLSQNHGEREALKKIGITKARPLIEAFYKTHKPIAHYFANGSDNGLKIMNLDSKIALDVIEHFIKQNVPILSVHDSFLMQTKYEVDLRDVMQKAYKKYAKGFTCIIK